MESKGLIERLFWLIRLRWIAVVGVIATTLFISQVVKLTLPFHFLYLIALVLAAYNLIFTLVLANIKKNDSRPETFLVVNRLANLQIFFDLASLASLLHFSGGIENPFLFYFIFHIIIAGILLSRRAAFIQATYAVTVFLLMVLLEYKGILAHYCLGKVFPYTLHTSILYILGIAFVFITTLYIAAYMATSIAGELRERERSLREANELLHEKDRIKSEYVLRVTHDIKEDLAAIQSCIEPVTEKITGSLNAPQEDLLKRAKDRSGKLITYVNALLEITKIKLAQKIKFEHFSFLELVKEISERTSSTVHDKSILLEAQIDPDLGDYKGVRIYIQEAISNILTNSIKYTPPNGRIFLKAKKQADSIVIEVEDTGIGIPKEELGHIFEEFYRASNARKIERQGTGLGLAIAKEIVEVHKGKISIESEENKGTKVTIILPLT